MPKSLSRMKKMRQKTKAGAAANGEKAVIIPTKNDVVFGRGRATLAMAGNINFRRTVWEFRDQYSKTHPVEKYLVCEAVLAEIRKLKPPGRFLCKHAKTGEWQEVSGRRVHEKVSQSLRDKKFQPPSEKDLMKLDMYQNTSKPAPCKGTSAAAKSQAAAAIKAAIQAKAAKTVDPPASSSPKKPAPLASSSPKKPALRKGTSGAIQLKATAADNKAAIQEKAAKTVEPTASSPSKKPALRKGNSGASKSKAAVAAAATAAATKASTQEKAAKRENPPASSAPKPLDPSKRTSGASKAKAAVAIKATTKPAKKKAARTQRKAPKAVSPNSKKKRTAKAKETHDAGLRGTVSKTIVATSSPAREPAVVQDRAQQARAVVTPSSSSASSTTCAATTSHSAASQGTWCGQSQVVTPVTTTACTSAPTPASAVRPHGWIFRPSKPSDYVGFWRVLFPYPWTGLKPNAGGTQNHFPLQSSPDSSGSGNNTTTAVNARDPSCLSDIGMLFGVQQPRQYPSGQTYGFSVSGGINVHKRDCGASSEVKGGTHAEATQVVPQNLFCSVSKTMDLADGCKNVHNNSENHCDNGSHRFRDSADYSDVQLSCDDASIHSFDGALLGREIDPVDPDMPWLLCSPEELDNDTTIHSSSHASDDDDATTSAGGKFMTCSAGLPQTTCGEGEGQAHEGSIWWSWNGDSAAATV